MAEQNIKINQDVEGEKHWSIIVLNNKTKSSDGKLVTGSWRHTNQSYKGEQVKFTDDHPDHLYWEWRGDARGGVVSIGSKMGRASHKAGETEIFDVYIILNYAKVLAGGRIAITGGFDFGAGRLNQNRNPHFTKGEITWNVEEE
jgi:hypothetical protein